MRFGNFVVVKHDGKIVCGKVGDQGIYLKQMGDAIPIPFREVEPLFEIEVHRPFPEHFKVDDFRKFVISTLTDADPVKGPHPAITHCEECGCDWLDNGLNPVGCPYCKQPTAVGEAMVERIATLLYEKATGEPWAVAGVEHPGPDRDYYRWLARKVAALAAQPHADDEVVFFDGVGAGRSSVKSCRDGVQWIRVGDRVYWPLSDSDAKRLQNACCGNGSFDGPATPASEENVMDTSPPEALVEAVEQQPGVCPECKGSCRTGSGYLREDCPACNGEALIGEQHPNGAEPVSVHIDWWMRVEAVYRYRMADAMLIARENKND